MRAYLDRQDATGERPDAGADDARAAPVLLTPRPAPKPVATAPVVQPAPRPDPLPTPPPGLSQYEWPACVHESGHMVAALARGLKVHSASVLRDCYVRFDRTADPHTDAVVTLSGPVAELLLCEHSDPFAPGGAASGDMEKLAALGLSPAAVAAARADAERLVSLHRAAIGSVANDLARWGVCDGAEAANLFNMNK